MSGLGSRRWERGIEGRVWEMDGADRVIASFEIMSRVG